MDHRNALYVFRDLMLKQLEIINMFRIGDYELYPISISLFLFSFASDFTMNAILFSDDIISQRYQNKGSFSLVTTLILTLLSNIIGFIISVIPSRLSNFSFALQHLKSENKKKIIFHLYNLLRIIKLKLILFFFYQFIMMLIYLYFLCSFCSVYQSSQWNWFKNGLIGIGTSLAITIGINILICVFRTIGIHFNYLFILTNNNILM